MRSVGQFSCPGAGDGDHHSHEQRQTNPNSLFHIFCSSVKSPHTKDNMTSKVSCSSLKYYFEIRKSVPVNSVPKVYRTLVPAGKKELLQQSLIDYYWNATSSSQIGLKEKCGT